MGRTLILWKGQSEIPAEVVGVARDLRDWGLDAGASRAGYIPFYGVGSSRVEFLVHAAGAPHAIVPAVRAILADLDPDLPLSNIRTMDESMGASVAERRFLMILLGVFAAIALLLALAGV